MRTLGQVLVSGVIVCLCSAPAWATHKSWNLVDPGANCRSASAGVSASKFVFADGSIKNTGTTSGAVTCPVTLAGRYGNQGSPQAYSMARWPTAREATVYGFDGSGSDDIRCNMIVMSNTGSVYSSSTRTQTPANANGSAVRVNMVVSGSWGLDIGTGTTLSIRTMGYNCNVPPGSHIYAYEEKICQYPNPNNGGVCSGGDTVPTGQVFTMSVVQDNGWACLADASNPSASMWRNNSGLQNTGSNPMNIYCPINRTSSDSRSQQGTGSISRIQVYAKGDVPTNCKLTCRSQTTGGVTSSATFVLSTGQWFDPLGTPPQLLVGSMTPACAGALGVSCSLPSLSTMLGFLHQDEVPPVDDGT